MRSVLFVACLVACGDVDRLASGTYDLTRWELAADGTATVVDDLPDVQLVLDVGAGTATLVEAGVDEVEVGLVPRAREAWVSQCPTNFTAALVEVADLDTTRLEIDGRGIEAPYVMAECRGGGSVYLGGGPGGDEVRSGLCNNDGGQCLVFR